MKKKIRLGNLLFFPVYKFLSPELTCLIMKKLHNKLTEKNQHSWILMEKLKKE
jgi:hypothetical protein